MNLEGKNEIVAGLKQKLEENPHFYLTDIAELDAEKTAALRRKCFENNIELVVVKNTLLKKALEQLEGDYEEIYSILKGQTSIMFTEVGNGPAKMIKALRKEGNEKPLIKGAFVEESIYIGDDQLDTLATIKSKDELVADVVALLQSPMKNLVSALQSAPNTVSGLVKALEERG